MKKFAIVSTWNGEGYSYSNELEKIVEGSFSDVKLMAKEMMIETQPNIEFTEEEDGFIFSFIGNDDDSGSFRVLELDENSFGIVITTQINQAEVLNEDEFKTRLEEAVRECDTEMLDEDELETMTVFIPAYEGEDDYQFIKVV